MERDLRVIKAPTELQSLWSPAHNISKPIDANCTKIAAGGDISMFVIDRPDSTEVLSCGFGQFGQLGNGSVYKSLKVFLT